LIFDPLHVEKLFHASVWYGVYHTHGQFRVLGLSMGFCQINFQLVFRV